MPAKKKAASPAPEEAEATKEDTVTAESEEETADETAPETPTEETAAKDFAGETDAPEEVTADAPDPEEVTAEEDPAASAAPKFRAGDHYTRNDGVKFQVVEDRSGDSGTTVLISGPDDSAEVPVEELESERFRHDGPVHH